MVHGMCILGTNASASADSAFALGTSAGSHVGQPLLLAQECPTFSIFGPHLVGPTKIGPSPNAIVQ